MTVTVELVSGDTTLNINDGTNYRLQSVNGLGLPPVNRLTESGPLQDGVFDLGFRYQPRTVNLIITMLDTTESGYYAKRRYLGSLLKPRNTPIYLRVTTPDGNVYQLDTYYNDGYGLNTADKVGPYGHRVPVSLVAPNPILYNPSQQVYSYIVGATAGSGFGFPIGFPVGFGSSTINTTQVISYDGDYPASPIIQLYGPITSPVITNVTSGEVLDLTGTTIADGDYYTIDTRYGYIAVTDSLGANKIDKLVGQSNLSGFNLIPHPDAINGANTIQVNGTGANTHTIIYMRYYEQYTHL